MKKELKFVLAILMVFVVVMNLIFAPSNILSWDVYGYYLYLPTTLIYHDLGLENKQLILDLMEQYNSSGTFYQAHWSEYGNHVMKYSMGMAVLYLPFFLLGWAGAGMFGYPMDGFSEPFQLSIFYGGIIYSILGLYYLAKVLNHFFSWKISSIVLVAVTIGTNYMVHATMYGQNAMSQNYLFTGYALMLWFTIQWHDSPNWRNSILIAAVGGLMALSRPTEIVVFLIPILWNVWSWDSVKSKAQLILDNWEKVTLMVVLAGVIGSFQLVYWKLYTGTFLYNSYGNNAGEGMELLSPYTRKFLFSFRKGWLLYTPLMLFSIWGIIVSWTKNRLVSLSLTVFLIVNVYFISSWSNWWYAQSFSQRAMVSSYPVMAIGLGYALDWMKECKRGMNYLWIGLFWMLIGYNIFQTIQFNKGVIHPDRMTKQSYFASFGKLSVSEEYDKLLLVDRSSPGGESFKYMEDYTERMFGHLAFEDSDGDKGHHGFHSMQLDSTHLYTPAIEGKYMDITQKDHVWFKISAWVYVQEPVQLNDLKIVAHFEHKGFTYNYQVYNIPPEKLKEGEWNLIQYYYLSPEVRKKQDNFKSYVWYIGKQSVLVDDLRVDVFEKK